MNYTKKINELVLEHLRFEERAIETEGDYKDSILIVTSDFFFANVRPYMSATKQTVEALKGEGICDYEYVYQDNYRLSPNPKRYKDFPLPQQYFYAFKECLTFFSQELEKDNFQFMEQVGAELTFDVTDSRFDEVRQLLSQIHLIEPVSTIIDGVKVDY